jgi:hypothetical protein
MSRPEGKPDYGTTTRRNFQYLIRCVKRDFGSSNTRARSNPRGEPDIYCMIYLSRYTYVGTPTVHAYIEPCLDRLVVETKTSGNTSWILSSYRLVGQICVCRYSRMGKMY